MKEGLDQFLGRYERMWILITTGKEQHNLSDKEPYNNPPRATLRDLVPQWLEESSFRSIISAYTLNH